MVQRDYILRMIDEIEAMLAGITPSGNGRSS